MTFENLSVDRQSSHSEALLLPKEVELQREPGFNQFSLQEMSQNKDILLALKALSDETRVRILRILSVAPLNVQEITEVLDMGQSRISRHLKILSDAGFLLSQREGSWVYYRPKDNKRDSSDFSLELHLLLLKFERNLPYSDHDLSKTKGILKQRDLNTSKYFNDVAKNWENIQRNVLDPVLYRNKILDKLPEFSSRILDLGCGPGGFIPYLLTKSKEVIGVDSSEKMIKEARSSFPNNPNVSFLEADLDALPKTLYNKSDAVVASMVLHHLSNPANAMREVHSALNEDGVFVIVDLKKHNQEFMRDNFADLWLGFEPELLQEWLIHTGFTIESLEEIESQKYFKVLIIKAKKRGGL